MILILMILSIIYSIQRTRYPYPYPYPVLLLLYVVCCENIRCLRASTLLHSSVISLCAYMSPHQHHLEGRSGLWSGIVITYRVYLYSKTSPPLWGIANSFYIRTTQPALHGAGIFSIYLLIKRRLDQICGQIGLIFFKRRGHVSLDDNFLDRLKNFFSRVAVNQLNEV